MTKDDDARKDYEAPYVPEGSTREKEDEDIEKQHREEDKDKAKIGDQMDMIYFSQKPAKRNIHFSKVKAREPYETLSIDLMDFNLLKKDNAGYGYVLICTDVFTRYTHYHLLHEKSSKEILKAFKNLFENGMTIPQYIWCDHESAIWGNEMQTFFMTYGIELYFTGNHSVFAEIAIKRIKSILYKWMYSNNTNRWYTIIGRAVDESNNTIIKTLGLSPAQMLNDRYHEFISNRFQHEETTYDDLNRREKFFADNVNVGDKVLKIKEGLFRKGYLPRWSKHIYTITKKIMHGDVPMFHIDEARSSSEYSDPIGYYSHQLMPVEEKDGKLVDRY